MKPIHLFAAVLFLSQPSPEAIAEVPDNDNPLCGPDAGWDRAQEKAKGGFETFAAPEAQKLLQECGLADAPRLSREAYLNRVDAEKRSYCNRRQIAFQTYEKLAGTNVEASGGQTCDPLKQTLANVESARTALDGLHQKISALADESRKALDRTQRQLTIRFRTCPGRISRTLECRLMEKQVGEARMRVQTLAEKNAEEQKIRQDSQNPCNQLVAATKNFLPKLHQEHNAFWGKEGPVVDRMPKMYMEKATLEAKVREMDQMKGTLKASLDKQRCDQPAAPLQAAVSDEKPKPENKDYTKEGGRLEFARDSFRNDERLAEALSDHRSAGSKQMMTEMASWARGQNDPEIQQLIAKPNCLVGGCGECCYTLYRLKWGMENNQPGFVNVIKQSIPNVNPGQFRQSYTGEELSEY